MNKVKNKEELLDVSFNTMLLVKVFLLLLNLYQVYF